MCKTCGCGRPAKHSHGMTGSHAHDHDHGAPGHSKVLTLERKVLAGNDAIAAGNRRFADKHGITVLNMISAPGSGKTLILERTLEALKGRIPCAVITGDLETDRDARRLQNRGAWVKQIETHQSCHLSAAHIHDLLPAVAKAGARLLFIENVGNLVCPAAFDLGEHFKVALLSVTEGEDKPLKYPTIFSLAAVVVLTKMDLLPHLDFDIAKARQYIRKIHPGVFVFETSARTGSGMAAWFDYLNQFTS